MEGRGEGAEVRRLVLLAGARRQQHHDARRFQVDPEPLGPPLHRLTVRGAAEKFGRQRGAGVPVGLDRAAVGRHLQRDQRRGAAHGDHVAPVETGLVLHHDKAAPDFSAELDRGDDMASQQIHLGQGPDHEDAAAVVLGKRPAHLRRAGKRRLEQARNRVLGPFGQRRDHSVAVRVEDRAGLHQQLGERPEQVVERLAVEHQLGQPLVDRGRAAKRLHLAAGHGQFRAQLQLPLGLGDRDRGQLREAAGRLGVLLGEGVLAFGVVEHRSARRVSSPTTIGTHITERIDQRRTVDLTMRVSLRALETITGSRVRITSRVTRSAGIPARHWRISAS